MDGQSLTEARTGGGGGNTNWKTLADIKTEHLGHGDKVFLLTHTRQHTLTLTYFFVDKHVHQTV